MMKVYLDIHVHKLDGCHLTSIFFSTPVCFILP